MATQCSWTKKQNGERPTPPTAARGRSTNAVAAGARVINASWGGPAFSQTLSTRRSSAGGDQGVLFARGGR
jgi:hypothetical protein